MKKKSILNTMTKSLNDQYGSPIKHLGTILSASTATVLVAAAKKNPVLAPVAYMAIGASATIGAIDMYDRTKHYIKNDTAPSLEERAEKIVADINHAISRDTQVVAEKAEEAAEVTVNTALDAAEIVEETVEEVKDQATEKAEEVIKNIEEAQAKFDEAAEKTTKEVAKKLNKATVKTEKKAPTKKPASKSTKTTKKAAPKE